VLALLTAFVDIALHRRGPQHLPASQFLFTTLLAASLVSGAVIVQVLPGYTFAAVVLETVLELAFVWCVLRAFERQRRFLQCAAAVLGTDVLFSAIRLPLLVWNRSIATPSGEPTLPALLDLLVIVWSIDVSASIMSRGLDRPYIVALAIVLGYVMLTLALSVTLFPSTT
jgi:hypothetical protein